MTDVRMGRIFASDGRTVILAIDHAGFMGPLPGLEDPGRLIQMAAKAGVDAILTTYGVAKTFGSKLGRTGLILRVDGGASSRNPGPLRRMFSIEDAVRLGADAVACMGMIGFDEEPASLRVLTELTAEAARWQVPVLGEMLVKTKDGSEASAADAGFAIRIGIELGADMIKVAYAPPLSEYKRALAECYRPVVVLGGPKSDDHEAFLSSIATSLEIGANGVAVGRNVWQHSDPDGMCRALVALVHGGASVQDAMREVEA